MFPISSFFRCCNSLRKCNRKKVVAYYDCFLVPKELKTVEIEIEKDKDRKDDDDIAESNENKVIVTDIKDEDVN